MSAAHAAVPVTPVAPVTPLASDSPLSLGEGPGVRSAPDTTTTSESDAHAAHAPHSAHAAHPDALRLRAVSLWCEGIRSPAIAKQLEVPERTIRAWLADARAAFQVEQGETTHDLIALAVQRQLAIAAAAWQSYHRAVELEQLALDYYHAGLNRTAHLKNIDDELPPPPPRPSTAPARYLSVALAAQREAARLSGCYDHIKAAATAAAWHERNPPPTPLTYAQTHGLDPADEHAWDGFLRHFGLSPARFAGPADLDELYRPAWEAFRRRLHARLASPTPSPATSATEIPAETATAPQAPPSRIGKGAGGLGPIPAETATASAPSPQPLASGSPFPPRREPERGSQVVRSAPPHPWQHMM